MEWGIHASEFNPTEHAKLFDSLNPLATFGSSSRICRGKALTLAIITYLLKETLRAFDWEVTVDGKSNVHPTEFNFNNGTVGEIQLYFSKKKSLDLSPYQNERINNWRQTRQLTQNIHNVSESNIFSNIPEPTEKKDKKETHFSIM